MILKGFLAANKVEAIVQMWRCNDKHGSTENNHTRVSYTKEQCTLNLQELASSCHFVHTIQTGN